MARGARITLEPTTMITNTNALDSSNIRAAAVADLARDLARATALMTTRINAVAAIRATLNDDAEMMRRARAIDAATDNMIGIVQAHGRALDTLGEERAPIRRALTFTMRTMRTIERRALALDALEIAAAARAAWLVALKAR